MMADLPGNYPPPRDAGCPLDPPRQLTRLLAEAPVHRIPTWNGEPAWLVTRHADHVALLHDERVSGDFDQPGYPSISATNEAFIKHNRTFTTLDDPVHGEQRRRFTKDFAVRRVRAMRPGIERLISGLLDDMERSGPPADLVGEFALPLPSLVICDLLGVPYQDRDFFQRASAATLDVRSSPEDVLAAAGELTDYLGGLLRDKAANPGEDLLSRIAVEYLNTGLSSYEECAKHARLMLVAGHETTANMISLGICALLQHPEQLAVVRDGDPGQVAAAVEELLRYLTVAHAGRRRVALADIEIGGEVIRAGDGIICATELANRDPAVFADPDSFDIHRERPQRHLAFGSGTHVCLGQHLARLELQLAYPALLRRFPRLALHRPVPDQAFRADSAIYGMRELVVTW